MKLQERVRRNSSADLSSKVVRPTETGTHRFVCLELVNDVDEQRQAYLDIDRWFASQQFSLPGIPWLQVPLAYLAGWLNEQGGYFCVAEDNWAVTQVTIAQPGHENLRKINAEPCELLSAHWPEAFKESDDSSSSLLGRLVFELGLVLGHSRLPLSLLHTLEAGDLLIVEHQLKVVTLNHRKVCAFQRIDETEIMIDKLSDATHLAEEELSLLFDWNTLPVDVEFVMPLKTLTLSEVDELKPGKTITLPEGAEKTIAVYLNRKLLAQGELVALENGQLAVEINRIGYQVKEELE